MRKIVHSLTMLLVLSHILAGCCWHHTHSATLASRGDASLVASCCSHGQHGHGNGQEPADAPHPQHGDCESGSCFFVLPQGDGWAGFAADSARVNGICWGLPVRGCIASGRLSDEAPPAQGHPPLRLHLVKQVLLI